MNILVISVALPTTIENTLGIQGQLFLNRLIKGLKYLNSKTTALTLVHMQNLEAELLKSDINYHIVSHRSTVKTIKSAIKQFKQLYDNSDDTTVVIVDGLNIKCLLTGLLIRLLYHIRIYAVLTDIPRFVAKHTYISKLIARFNELLDRCTDGFIFLTEEMNQLINIKEKPYCIIEGFVDSAILNPFPNKLYSKKVILYAGGVSSLYGVNNLVDAFIMLNNKDFELHIYGKGDYVETLKEICLHYTNIKYCGVLQNIEIIKREREAFLLANPRPISDLYTIYSFPSKTLEYMASATPFITTKLKCIPQEYNKYLNYFENDDVAGIKNSLEAIINTPYDDLKAKALDGYHFVSNNKINTVLCKRIIKMITNN